MNEKKQTSLEESAFFKPAVILLVLGLILFFSLDKSSLSESNEYSPFLLGWLLAGVIALIIHVYIVRWAFKIDDIVSNQEKTNHLLESIHKALSKPEDVIRKKEMLTTQIT